MTKKVKVIGIEKLEFLTRISFEFHEIVDFNRIQPVCPATLYMDESCKYDILDLHKLEKVESGVVFCQSFGSHSLPQIGHEYWYQGWWIPSAFSLVEDVNREWVLELYPDNGEHEHCPLTWKKISAKDGDPKGYRSGDIWISEEGYEKYIRDDMLQIRRSQNHRQSGN